MSTVARERSRPPVVVVTGPTASGKTPLAIELAERFGGEIVNADSMQVYRYLDIGTSKPSAEQRARVPHHVFDVVSPDEVYSAGRYSREARAAAARIRASGRTPILVGGTGLYIRAFLEGLVEGGGADPELRARLEAEHASAVAEGDPARLHRRLADRDAGAAQRIHPNDLRRVIRALELCERAGGSASGIRERHGFRDRPYRSLHLVLDPGRTALDHRIDARCRAMVEGGLLQEVRRLRQRGYGPELRPLRSIGYRHMAPVADGVDTLANALRAMQLDTRRFARRQRTWLRSVEGAVWLDPDDEQPPFEAIEQFLCKPA